MSAYAIIFGMGVCVGMLLWNALDSQRYMGLSGEDTYTVLAYYALRELERHWQVNMAHLNMMPSPSVILRDADKASESLDG